MGYNLTTQHKKLGAGLIRSVNILYTQCLNVFKY